ncbi:MmgE/PrpD family protein [Glaciibacter sp. 2TAF33]|uniref:MmgE/PrpD family protein n=1 Tax=Glaciibacter sp. 2TAF33 TaxID=3233015 RepID=UPI003F907E1A
MGSAESVLADLVTGAAPWSMHAQSLALDALTDTLAVGVAGANEEQSSFSRSILLPSEHPDAVGTWSGPARFALADAAFLAGVATHSLDWDDYMHPMHGHCSAVLLATAWPVAEHTGASGARLLDAFLVGYQVDYLASLALGHEHYRRGWHATSSVGTLGAAAVASRMLGLTTGQAGHALAIAASLAGGLRVNFGTATKAVHAGAAARNGVQAAQLARAGVSGSEDWLLGDHGMLAVFGGDRAGEPAAQAAAVISGAGRLSSGGTYVNGIETEWGLVQKPYCCCGSCHAAVEAVIGLATDHDLAPDGIRSLTVHVDPIVPGIMQVEVPWDAYSARYSPTWVMAAAAIDRAAGPAQFGSAALDRSDIHHLRERVLVVPDLVTTDADRFAGRVEIDYRGRVFSREIRHALGHPKRPMSAGQRAGKQYAALGAVLAPEDAEAVIRQANLLPVLPRVSTLGALIRSAARR